MAERGRPPKGVERSNILLRIPTDLIEQIDTFKENLEAERGGFGINRTDMLIRLIEVGLQTLTQERQPAPASHVNGQGAPAPQPTTQPAIPLALEPAPKTAHPVDVPQAAEAPAEPVPALSYDNNTVLQDKDSQSRGSRGEMRQRILTLLREHPKGLSAEELRVYLKPEKPLGDTLQGMVRQQRLIKQGSGKDVRYLAAEAQETDIRERQQAKRQGQPA
jgi:hypothetical protein